MLLISYNREYVRRTADLYSVHPVVIVNKLYFNKTVNHKQFFIIHTNIYYDLFRPDIAIIW